MLIVAVYKDDYRIYCRYSVAIDAKHITTAIGTLMKILALQ